MSKSIISSEAMGCGHPDKVADFISDSVLDACLAADPNSRVGCEVLVKGNHVVLAGEISTLATPDYEGIVRSAIRALGYRTSADDPVFNAESVIITNLITEQSPDIARGVDADEQGAGDQGIMFGYACDETPELMPAPLMFANRIMRELDRVRSSIPWLRPDSKCQVAVEYDEDGKPTRIVNVVLSTQHAEDADMRIVHEFCIDLIRDVLPVQLMTHDTQFFINPTGRFVVGGPQADCGLTGRKIIADTYGGVGRHGGGAFSGKDCSKVDRSAAYMCRWVAKHVVAAGLAHRCEVQVGYAIGKPDPVSIHVESDGDNALIEQKIAAVFSFRPADIERTLGLRKPIFRMTTNYGHFGKAGLPWENVEPGIVALLTA